MKLPLRFSLMMSLAVTSLVAGVAIAADTLPTPLVTPKVVSATQQATRLNALKTHGASEIDRRLDSLQKALLKVQDSAQLAAADKQTLQTQLQGEIDSLTQLKSKLAGETNLAAARVDVNAVFEEYRVYALMLPKARLIAAADRFTQAGQQLQAIAAQLQAKITAAQAQNKDTAAAQAKLDDMKARLATAQPAYQGLAAKVLPLTPADFNANHKLLTDSRDSLKSARDDLGTARADAQDAVAALKSLKAKQ